MGSGESGKNELIPGARQVPFYLCLSPHDWTSELLGELIVAAVTVAVLPAEKAGQSGNIG